MPNQLSLTGWHTGIFMATFSPTWLQGAGAGWLQRSLGGGAGSQARTQQESHCSQSSWLLWIKVTGQEAGARRACWPSLFSLNSGNKSPLWKGPSFLWGVGFSRETPFSLELRKAGSKAYVNKAPYSFTNLLPKPKLCLDFSLMSTKPEHLIPVSSSPIYCFFV